MTAAERIDAAVAAGIVAGESRARLVAELLIAAATLYDAEAMASGESGRRDQFAVLAASAHGNASAALKRALGQHAQR